MSTNIGEQVAGEAERTSGKINALLCRAAELADEAANHSREEKRLRSEAHKYRAQAQRLMESIGLKFFESEDVKCELVEEVSCHMPKDVSSKNLFWDALRNESNDEGVNLFDVYATMNSQTMKKFIREKTEGLTEEQKEGFSYPGLEGLKIYTHIKNVKRKRK